MSADLTSYLNRRVFNNKKFGISAELTKSALEVWESIVQCDCPTPFASAGRNPTSRTPFVFLSWNNEDYYIEVEIYIDNTEWCCRDRKTDECKTEIMNDIKTIPEYIITNLKKMVKQMRNYTVISKREELEFEIEGKHFFTSDTHFSHGNIIKYCKRPFMSGEEEFMLESGKHFRVSQSTIDLMNVTMVDRINAEVGPKDVLWHLGDFAWNGIGVVKEFLDKINCKNINLIWGNHDYPEMAKLFPNNWEQCLLIADGKHIHLNHYPQHSWEGSHHGWWHLFGHVHGGLDKNRLENPAWAMSMDIGVDSHDFYPKSLAQIESIFSKRDLEFKKFKDSMLPKETGGMAPV